MPLLWGEAAPDALLRGEGGATPFLARLERTMTVRPIDTLSLTTLDRDVALIIQPRRLAPHELVALDDWVRRGGRALIFADPDLRWESRYAPGDPRRPPPVTLLDPLFAHWGAALEDADGATRRVTVAGVTVTMVSAGRWQAPRCALSTGPIVTCRIGAGQVVLIGDADLFDARLGDANVNAAVDLVRGLASTAKTELNPSNDREHPKNIPGFNRVSREIP